MHSAAKTNSFIESWIGGLIRETLDYFLCFSLSHLDHVNQSYARFYNTWRPRQGLGNRTLPAATAGPPEELVADPVPALGRVRCERFLGGLLRHYYRDAA